MRINGTNGDDSLTNLGFGDEFYGFYGNDIIKGSSGNDTMYAGVGNDTLYGYVGNDSLDGGDGDDLIYGGDGDDIIKAGAGTDSIYGGNGADTVFAGAGNDYIQGNDGNDYLDASSGDDTIFGQNGNDTIYGGAGNDSIDCGAGNDSVLAGDGNDIIFAREGNDTIHGQNGNDILYANIGNSSLDGGSGSDTLIGGSGNDTLDGGAGNDSITDSTGHNEVIAGMGDDYVVVGAGNDTIYGGAGKDTLYGGVGNDSIDAGDDNDLVYTGDGNDFALARGGNDTLYGQNGNDTLYANLGNNELYGGQGNDVLYGGSGNDLLDGDVGNDLINGIGGNNLIKAGAGADTVNGASGSDTVYGGTGSDSINGGAGNDSLDGGADNDTINGNDGNDTIYGQAGDDLIHGGAGNDSIIGNDGNDTIYGDSGNDTIIAGKGNNFIHIGNNNGHDLVKKSDGVDTIVIDDVSMIDNLTFNLNGFNATIVNGDNSLTLENYLLFNKNHSVKYVQVGENTYSLKDIRLLSRGNAALNNIVVNKNELFFVNLTNPFGASNYKYVFTTASESASFNLEYLENGRLVVEGDNLRIKALSGQADDLTIWGDFNSVDTGDENDIVRLGGAVDSDYAPEYFKTSNNNMVSTGSGDDYVNYNGIGNVVDTGAGDDIAISLNNQKEQNMIVNAIVDRNYEENEPALSVNDGEITSSNQGGTGGNCRALAIIESITQKHDLSDYVSIMENGNGYLVTFDNYNKLGTSKTMDVSEQELEEFGYAYGDLDVVLTDCALEKLLKHNGDSIYVQGRSYIETASYNTLAQYFFGNENMAVAPSNPTQEMIYTYGWGDSYSYSERVEAFWNLYQNDTINNMTVSFDCEDDYKLGIISNHAYAIKDYVAGDNGYISLVNVWDNKDVLNLDLETFYSIEGMVFVYGYKYAGEVWEVKNVDTGRSVGSDAPLYADVIAQQTESWLSANAANTAGFIADNNTTANTEVLASLNTAVYNTDLDGLIKV